MYDSLLVSTLSNCKSNYEKFPNVRNGRLEDRRSVLGYDSVATLLSPAFAPMYVDRFPLPSAVVALVCDISVRSVRAKDALPNTVRNGVDYRSQGRDR